MSKIIQPEYSNFLSDSCSDEKSSICLLNAKCNNFIPEINHPFSLNYTNKHRKVAKKDSKSAPVSISNTPDWQRKKPPKNNKSWLFPNQFNKMILSTNSSENNFLAINCNLYKPNANHNCTKSNFNQSTTKPDHESKLKTSCLCWCCYCTLSCLNFHSSENSSRPQISNDLTSRMESIIHEESLTIDLVRKWSESFDLLIQNPAGQKVFGEFLKLEYSEENILFYLACEDLKNETLPDVVEEKARYIYEDYISILSPKEVSLDSRVREIINDNMVEPTAFTFDEAQLQIYTLMHRDSYPRFLNSKLFKDLILKLQNESQI